MEYEIAPVIKELKKIRINDNKRYIEILKINGPPDFEHCLNGEYLNDYLSKKNGVTHFVKWFTTVVLDNEVVSNEFIPTSKTDKITIKIDINKNTFLQMVKPDNETQFTKWLEKNKVDFPLWFSVYCPEYYSFFLKDILNIHYLEWLTETGPETFMIWFKLNKIDNGYIKGTDKKQSYTQWVGETIPELKLPTPTGGKKGKGKTKSKRVKKNRKTKTKSKRLP